jgi:hypothetical protein
VLASVAVDGDCVDRYLLFSVSTVCALRCTVLESCVGMLIGIGIKCHVVVLFVNIVSICDVKYGLALSVSVSFICLYAMHMIFFYAVQISAIIFSSLSDFRPALYVPMCMSGI